MKQCRKGLAILLIVCMMVSMLPSAAFAQNESKTADTVVYNLLDEEITVGNDAAQAEETPWAYKLFETDGSYTIQLEENAFFPYEVQFTCDGVVDTVWFATPESTVEIGGHLFSVHTEQNDATQLSQLGFYIGSDYVPAYPEPKEFSTTSSGISFYSLLPLEEKRNVSVDLTGYTPAELKQVKVSTILNGMIGENFAGTEAVVWAKQSDDNDEFHIISQNETIDLVSDHRMMNLQLIVGTANQLDADNIRYIVNITTSNLEEWLMPELYLQEENGSRSALEIYHSGYYSSSDELYMEVAPDKYAYGTEAYLGLRFGTEFENRDVTVAIYRGAYTTLEEVKQAVAADASVDITNQIWNQDMAKQNAGYKADYTAHHADEVVLTIVLFKDNTAVGMQQFYVDAYPSNNGLEYSQMRAVYKDGHTGYVGWGDVQYHVNGFYKIATFYVTEKAILNAQFCSSFDYRYRGGWDHTGEHIEKAVMGNYDSLAAAASQADIKEQLFVDEDSIKYTDDWYLFDYCKDGVDFTFFAEDGEIYKIAFKFVIVEGDETYDEPYLGELLSGDPYFQAKRVNKSQIYRVKSEDDEYYTNGYQTLLVLNSDVNLSQLKLTFDKAEKAHIYVNGEIQTSGESIQDFSNGPVQYSASAEDGKHLKNYWVTVVQQTAGAKLFVNGANVKNDAGEVVREVFLNDIYGNHHDIFIANIGNAELTGLNAVLSDAQNVKLDDYWTVGGDGNNTLAAFTTVSSSTSYGELANVAKIRLVPDGDGVVSGTLTISADDQEPVVIKLTGVAGNPKIVTAELPDAVKYVPYGSLIQHNNMYDWNTVSFEVVGGALPDGMIIKENGELYGVPTQTGTFEFTIRMDNSDERFSSSEATFTLNVLENTDENVDGSTDAGYDVSIRVPELMTSYRDEVFESQGELPEFVDFWLDGEQLVQGTDYIAEKGSTKITVRSQTFQKAGPGKHTIAAEFRVNGDENKELKRAAQNYELKLSGSTSSGGSSGGSGSSSSGGVKQPVQPTTPVVTPQETQTTVFADVPNDAWYAGEVAWVYENGLMVGVGNHQFAPNAEISHATVVTVLARVGKINLTPYTALQYGDIENNQWYSAAAKWAKAEDLLARQFSPNPPMPRGELAVILVKYLKELGVTFPGIAEPAIFADAAQMTEEEERAFQILYQAGIFKGKDENLTMDAQGSTTRAELATLLHRIDTILKAK